MAIGCPIGYDSHMSTPHLLTYLTFGVYLVLLLGIGVWGDRRFGHSYKGFVAADKRLGGWVSAISAAASSESAWVMLGLSGLGYAKGLAGYWAALGCILGFVVTSLLVIRQLRRSSEKLDALTLSDFIEARLGDRVGLLRMVSAIVIVVFMTVYVVAQFTGSGKQMAGMGLLSYEQGVMMGAAIIGIYVIIGGYAAVCWTDLIQGMLMAVVMVLFPIIGVVAAGGPGPVLESLASEDAGLLVGGQGLSWMGIGFVVAQLGIGTGYLGMPHSVVRYINVRDDREARRAAVITIVWSVFVLMGAVTLGIVGRVVLPGLEDPETILPRFTAAYLHPLIAGVVLASVMAAIMSTADSQLMMAATSIVHDLLLRFSRRPWSERGRIWATRGFLALLAALSMGLALLETKVIYTFVLLAWGALGAAFSPVVLLCLYWPRFNRWGALASLVVGPIVVILWTQLLDLESTDGIWPAFLLSLLAAVIATLLTARPDPELWRRA